MSGYTALDQAVFGTREAGCDASETPGLTTSHSVLDTTNLAPNLGLLNVQANTTVAGTSPGCNGTGAACGPAVFGGDKGIAIGQVLDAAGITVSADPNAKTVTVNGGRDQEQPDRNHRARWVVPECLRQCEQEFRRR